MRAATEMRRRIGTILATPPAENCGLTIRKRAQRGAVNLGCRAPKMCAFWRTLGDPAKCAKTRRVLAHVRQKLFNTAAPSRRKSRSESSHWRAILFRFTCASLAVCHGHARRGHDPSGMNPNMPASFGVANPRRRPPRAAGHCLAPAGLQTSASFGRPCRRGEGAKGRLGDKETRRQGDKETRRQGDKETRRQGDKETRRQGDPFSRGACPRGYLHAGSQATPQNHDRQGVGDVDLRSIVHRLRTSRRAER